MPALVDFHHLLLIGAAELFWTAHTDAKGAWQTEYRSTGA
jgi:hypothetical protein